MCRAWPVLCLRSIQVVKKPLSLLGLSSKAHKRGPKNRSQGKHIHNVRAFRPQFEIAEATFIAVPSYGDSEFEGAQTGQGRRGARVGKCDRTHQSGVASLRLRIFAE